MDTMVIPSLKEYYGTGYEQFVNIFNEFKDRNWNLEDLSEDYPAMNLPNFIWDGDYQNMGQQLPLNSAKEYYIPKNNTSWYGQERFLRSNSKKVCYFTKDHYKSFLCVSGGRNVSHIRVYACQIGDNMARNKKFYNENGIEISYNELIRSNRQFFNQKKVVWVESYNIKCN